MTLSKNRKPKRVKVRKMAQRNILNVFTNFLLISASTHILFVNSTTIKNADQWDINDGKDTHENQDNLSYNISKDMSETITTNNPCLVHYCPKGRECTIDTRTNQPVCICQRYCSHRKRLICGSDGRVYENHCELHRAACNMDRQITYQRLEKCLSGHNKVKLHKIKNTVGLINGNPKNTTDSSQGEVRTSDKIDEDNFKVAAIQPNGSGKSGGVQDNEIENNHDKSEKHCCSQEYEIMKDNLLLYNHARLMTQDNNHSKDFLISIMFSHYDQNNNAHLEFEELNQISIAEHLDELSNGCILDDMLTFDDIDHDGRLSINEFYQAFSKLYSVSVVSLDKALETNHLSARVGDNVEIKCDVTGSPSPPIIWRRNNVDLSSISDDEIRVFNDGSLYLTRIQLYHSGNYTCHAQRNKDVVQTHILSVYTIPEVHVMPRLQPKRPGEVAEMWCHVTGDPFPRVEWLKNNENINLGIPGKFEVLGNGTSLKIHNIDYADTGAYMCQATNVGGRVREIASLIVQEEPTPTALNEDRKFFVFHEYGIAIYEPSACRLYHQIQGTDIIPGTRDYVCGYKKTSCSWGRVINVGTRHIYASQPANDRILVVSTVQMIVTDVILTDKYPVELHYVPHLDQVWVLNWRYPENIDAKTVQVIPEAGQKRKHHTVHPEPIDGQFDLVKSLFVPGQELEQPHYTYRYGYVTHKNQRGLYKLDLVKLRYTKSVDLTLYNCVPENIEFSALYGFVIIFCREPVTNRPQGQLLLDYLTDSVLTAKPMLNGVPHISPDSRYLATIQYNSDGVVIVIQKITPNGLDFLFDVKTSLNISDITFYQSQVMHGYDLFAAANDKEDILYLNLFTGKVEMITGVGQATPLELLKWGNSGRMIRSSGLFSLYMVTPAKSALFVLNGKEHTVNCEIGGISYPTAIVWMTNSANYASELLQK